MMGMGLTLAPRVAQIHLLEYQFSVLPKLAAAGNCTDGYEVDALLIELCPGFKPLVEAFYNDDGPPLREAFSRQDIALLDRYLVQVLRMHERKAA
ncbi:MAG: hypothetical protein ACYTFZ_09600 [Planctomycetota bacterium]|jgi:hypothetical protein